jgi:hypothetical protein
MPEISLTVEKHREPFGFVKAYEERDRSDFGDQMRKIIGGEAVRSKKKGRSCSLRSAW